MSETEKPAADRYRDTAEEIRLVAQCTRSPEIRIELFDLADRYDRMATHAARRDGLPINPRLLADTGKERLSVMLDDCAVGGLIAGCLKRRICSDRHSSYSMEISLPV
jgi:hypothetical protein